MKECPTCRYCEDDVAEVCPRDGAKLWETIPGSRIIDERYRLDRVLGSGGMGTVYEALHVGLRRHFALKLLRSGNLQFLKRFAIEAAALGKLKHPHIVDVSDFGVDPRGDGLAYLVMEFLEGVTLSRYCESFGGTIPVRSALPVLEAIAEAIDYAHQNGIMHGDLKPANIFVGPKAELKQNIKILDFGLARFIPKGYAASPPSIATPRSFIDASSHIGSDQATTMTAVPGPTLSESVAGTPGYMAPEMFQGSPPTAGSDIYAFGIVVFQVLTGKLPFADSTLMSSHPSLVPPSPSGITPSLPAEIDEPIATALKMDPSQRPSSARELFRNIEAAVEQSERRAWRAREVPRRLIMAFTLGILLTLVAAVAWQTSPLQRLEVITGDLRFEQLPRRPVDPRILIVSIDEASLDADRTPLTGWADQIGRQVDRMFQFGARGVAVDLLLPVQWSQSEVFSQTVLRHAASLTLSALSTVDGTVIGTEWLNPLTSSALGPQRFSELFTFVNVEEDADGVVRRANLSFTDQAGEQRKAFAARAAELLAGSPVQLLPDTAGVWVDTSIDRLQFQRLSWKDLDGALDQQPSMFKDRLIILGAEYEASGDVHRIPGRPLQPVSISGLVLQSMMVNTILNGQFVTGWAPRYTFALVALFSVVVAAGVLCRDKSSFGILLMLAAVGMWVFFCFFLFLSGRIMVQMVSPVISIVGTGILGLVLRSRLQPFPNRGLRA